MRLHTLFTILLSSRLISTPCRDWQLHAALLTSRVPREGCLPDCQSGRQSERSARTCCYLRYLRARGSLAASIGLLAASIELLFGLAKQTLRHDRRERDRRREANGRSGLVRHVGDAKCAYVLGVGARLYADALQQACEHTKRREIGTTCPRGRQPSGATHRRRRRRCRRGRSTSQRRPEPTRWM